MASTPALGERWKLPLSHGATMSFRLSEQVAMVIVHVALLWSGAKRTLTYHFQHLFAAAAAAAVASPSTAEVDGDAMAINGSRRRR